MIIIKFNWNSNLLFLWKDEKNFTKKNNNGGWIFLFSEFFKYNKDWIRFNSETLFKRELTGGPISVASVKEN